jgi:tRNA A-37 threonylcarbamoyl transferase component Bud32
VQAQSTTSGLGRELGGRYQLIQLLGQGGAGAVFLAKDAQLFDRPVAVKELIEQFATEDERREAIARFTHEAQMLVQLRHPNLPDVHSYFAEHGRQYLVMEYIEGHTLLDLLKRVNGALPPATVIEWGRQICDVLAYLHSRVPPVIFRDIKPANIMLDKHGRIKLIDFGTARIFDTSKHTDTLKMGSIGYAPPEQYQGQGQTSPQTDIYALGATLHQLLTNQDPSARPFVFTPPSLVRPEVPEGASRAIMRALNLDPAQRFTSAVELRRALEQGMVDAPTAALGPVATSATPNPWLMALLAVLGAGVLEAAVLAPAVPYYGAGTASANWWIDYGVMVAPALGAALGSALASGRIRHPVRATLMALLGALVLSLGTGFAIVAIGHGVPRHISLRLLAILTFLAAVAGATLMRGVGAGE